jgi:glutathione S-transferase
VVGCALRRPLRLVIYNDFPAVLDAGDRDYLPTRERTLLSRCADPSVKLAAFQQACAPLERTLSAQPYICGPEPAYADYSVFSVFQWARLGSPKEVVAPGSAIADWRRRMISLFGNLGDRFPGYPM